MMIQIKKTYEFLYYYIFFLVSKVKSYLKPWSSFIVSVYTMISYILCNQKEVTGYHQYTISVSLISTHESLQ